MPLQSPLAVPIGLAVPEQKQKAFHAVASTFCIKIEKFIPAFLAEYEWPDRKVSPVALSQRLVYLQPT